MKSTNMTRRNVIGALAACGLMAGARRPVLAQATAAAGPGPILMENDRVRVYGVLAKPGQAVFGARSANPPPRLAVFMRDGKVKLARNGEVWKVTAYKLGDLVWDASNVTLAENADSQDISVYLVEPKGKPVAGEANSNWKPTSPQVGGRIVYENDYLRVIEHAARPRMGVCGEGMHTHIDHLTVQLNDARVRIMKPDHEPVIVEPKAGRVFWDPGGPHAVQNVGNRTSRAFLIEIKTG
jgi:hypothetical protein